MASKTVSALNFESSAKFNNADELIPYCLPCSSRGQKPNHSERPWCIYCGKVYYSVCKKISFKELETVNLDNWAAPDFFNENYLTYWDDAEKWSENTKEEDLESR